MEYVIIVIDGKVTFKHNGYTLVPAEVSTSDVLGGDDVVEWGSDGSWTNHTKMTFWSEFGEQEYQSAVAEYGSK